MLERVIAYEFVRRAESGRTGPIVMRCNEEASEPLELFCKLSGGCDEGVVSLVHELIAACLAADLNLPIPIPYLVETPRELAEIIVDKKVRETLYRSSSLAFGSKYVGSQFLVWTAGTKITPAMLPSALATFIFDAVIDNPDRRPSNPNCLVAGSQIRLIDHELAFQPPLAFLSWRPPWEEGGMHWLEEADRHIFLKELKQRGKNRLPLDFGPIRALWSALSDARLGDYRAAIPDEWNGNAPVIDAALERIRNARDNIDGVVAEAERVLQ